MNGYTETQEQIEARAMRRALGKDAINLYLRQTTEADEEALQGCIFAAELDDAAEVDDNPADLAEVGEISSLPLNPRTQFTACVEYDYDYHLQHGFTEAERTELQQWWNEHYSRPPYMAQCPTFSKRKQGGYLDHPPYENEYD